MQPYQSFLPNQQMMNPYQNNFNQPMPMQNPYLDRINQLQQYQQNLQMVPTQMSGPTQIQQPQGIIGKVVNDFSEITANDVPMNGMSAVFPKNDGSEVQIRSWSADGKIQTISYKPILEQNQIEQVNTPQNDFTALNEDMRALREEISERFDRLEKSMGGTATKATASKEKKGNSGNE